MGSRATKIDDYIHFGSFKQAMLELAKNKNMSINVAEKAIGLERDFTEQVDRGIKEPSLQDVVRIAKFFNTTIDSVLDGGHREIRVRNGYGYDSLTSQYYEECVEKYVHLLQTKAINAWKTGCCVKQVQEGETVQEIAEQQFVERFKIIMEESERQEFEEKGISKCCDEALISELVKRGFKVEKRRCKGGEATNKSGR